MGEARKMGLFPGSPPIKSSFMWEEEKRSRGKILIFLSFSDQAEDGNPNITTRKLSLWTASPNLEQNHQKQYHQPLYQSSEMFQHGVVNQERSLDELLKVEFNE